MNTVTTLASFTLLALVTSLEVASAVSLAFVSILVATGLVPDSEPEPEEEEEEEEFDDDSIDYGAAWADNTVRTLQ